MFKMEQLEHILQALNDCINNYENKLDKYGNFLSLDEKKEMLNQIETYRDISLRIEGIIGNIEAEKILEGGLV